MRNIKVDSLRAGMTFNKSVYIEGNNILVPPDIAIKQKDLDRLIKWNIDEVFTEGDICDPSSGSKIIKQATDYNNSTDNTLEFYNTAIKQMEEVFLNIHNATDVSKTTIDAVVTDIFTGTKEHSSILVQKILAVRLNQKNLAISAVHCAILVAIIGNILVKSRPELIDIITAALLHDIGMSQIPDSILSKQDKLTVEDIKRIRVHADLSHNIIKKLGFFESIARIAIHHHEKWNGNGYPGKLVANEIPLGSRIIAVADTYIALVNNRPYRNYVIGYNAMKAILSDNGTHFDPEIIKIFLKTIGIYPIGSMVKLSDQSIGRVVGINSKAPLRPQIVLLHNAFGKMVDNKIEIDLLQQQDLFIIKAMDPKQLEL